MDTVIGILLLVSFFGLVYLAIRGKNMTVLLFFTAILWGILAIIGGRFTFDDMQSQEIQAAMVSYGGNLVSLMFGAWLGKILVETNIAGTLIRKTAELGGDRAGLTMVLLNIVTVLIFTSSYGVGIVMAIGFIILPILTSLGVPKKLASASYIMSLTAGVFINPGALIYWSMVFPDLDINSGHFRLFVFIAAGITLVLAITMSLIGLSRSKKVHAWAVEVSEPQDVSARKVPGYALVTPILPVLLVFLVNIQIIPALIITIFLAMLLTGRLRKPSQAQTFMLKAFGDGISEIGLLFAFLLGVAMLNQIGNVCAPFFQAVLGSIIPKNPLIILIAFIILAPLAMYRGPLTMFGTGVATATILVSTGYFPPSLIYILICSVSTLMTMTCCPTQSWTQWCVGYMKITSTDFIKQTIVYVWIAAALSMIVGYIMYV